MLKSPTVRSWFTGGREGVEREKMRESEERETWCSVFIKVGG